MFPEGTRREKGLRKRHEARWRSGAARIALEAGVPLVPAAISGTDGVEPPAGWAARRVWGSDPARRPRGLCPLDDAAHVATDRLSATDHRARGVAAVKPLLAVDGDSFAHRAFHALPQLVQARRRWPRQHADRASCRCSSASGRPSGHGPWSSAGTRSFVPTYRNGLLETYQSGREFDPEILDQLALAAGARLGDRASLGERRAGYEVDYFLAAAVRAERKRRGTAVVANVGPGCIPARGRRRDDPAAGARRVGDAAHGPAEVRERYGVEPALVRDLIALRGDPSDGLPGAKGGRPEDRGRCSCRRTPIWRR